jgi:hypothetical protein
MPEKIRWSVQFQVVDGPGVAKTDSIDVDSYEKTSLTVPLDGNSVLVTEPALNTGDVQLVVIKADPCGPWLSYTTDGGTTATLDAPHALVGTGAVGLMQASAPPKTLSFKADTAKLAHDPVNKNATVSIVQILVGRKAT